MIAWLAAVLMVIGAGLMLLASIGIWRFPDVFTRMQAVSKVGTLGIGCLMTSVAIHFAKIGVTTHVGLIVLFFTLTTPVAAQRIARAAHRIRVPLWGGTHGDQLRAAEDAEAGRDRR